MPYWCVYQNVVTVTPIPLFTSKMFTLFITLNQSLYRVDIFSTNKGSPNKTFVHCSVRTFFASIFCSDAKFTSNLVLFGGNFIKGAIQGTIY